MKQSATDIILLQLFNLLDVDIIFELKKKYIRHNIGSC